MNNPNSPENTEVFHLNDSLNFTLSRDKTESIPLSGRIKAIEHDRLLVDLEDISLLQANPIRPNTPVQLELASSTQDTSEYQPFQATLSPYSTEFASSLHWLILPIDFKEKLVQRRNFVRVPCNFVVTIQAVRNHHTHHYTGASINLSGRGLRFASDQAFTRGEVLTVTFTPHPSEPPFHVKGVVILSTTQPPGTHGRHPRLDKVTAIKFLELPSRDEDRLVGICFKLQLLQQKHLR